LIASTAQANLRDSIAERLTEARQRTLLLIEPLADEQLNTVYSPILSPLAWDLGHIANFEELWLVQRVGEREPLRGELGRFYDAIENPRKVRNELPILRGDELRSYMADVRERTLDVLEEVELYDTDDRLLASGFVYEMLLAHEHQHNETMLQLLQMVDGYEPVRVDESVAAEPASDGPEMVTVEAGEHEIGAGDEGFAYDNERPRHTVELGAFKIDRTPVTNGAFAEFVADTGSEPPMYWERDGGGWVTTVFGRREPIDPALPVIHVDWHQADAFARWAGKRLPTEFEWEAAAAGADRERANLDQLGFGCAPAGAYGDAAGDCGAVQMLGDVWEWTSSDFEAYPGFTAFPYPEYSEVFFGDTYKVLRGGAWATRTSVIRNSFRNWDLPERAQIFSGIRCVRDL
jgi:gamma-glutamyl hercynylcysteine S-oxide synthase